MDDAVDNFIKENLWNLLECINLTENQLNLCLNQRDSQLETAECNSECNEENNLKTINFGWQSKWLKARLCKRLGVKKDIIISNLFKAGYFEQLTKIIEFSPNVNSEIHKLFQSIIDYEYDNNCLTKQISLSNESLEEISNNLQKHPYVTIEIIKQLLSPCLSEFSITDQSLTNLYNSSLNVSIIKLKKDPNNFHKDIFLQLLSTICESTESINKIKNLIKNNIVTENEIIYSLIVNGGNPPRLLQLFCDSTIKTEKSLINNNGKFNSKFAFNYLTSTKQHWLIKYLSDCYKCISDDKIDLKVKEKILEECKIKLIPPLLLLMTWEKQCCDTNTISLLNKYCKVNEDIVFERLGILSERRSTVLNWIIQQNKKYTPILKCSILNKLENNSTLRILYENDCLINTTSDLLEVEKLLKISTNEWEVKLFKGFIIIKNTLDLIWKSVTDAAYAKQLALEDEIQNYFSNSLKSLHKDIDKLFPLTFRVEILENLFSLIFLRYEDILTEDINSDSGGDDDNDLTRNSSSATLVYSKGSITSLETIQSRRCTNINKNNINRGFICSSFIIKELLNCLSECLVDCRAALYKQRSNTNESNISNLDKDINQLTQHVAEALWRYRLVCDLPKNINNLYVPCEQNGYPSTASSSSSDSEADNYVENLPQRRLSYSSKRSKSEGNDRSSDSSNTTGTSMSGDSLNKRIRYRYRAEKKLPGECDSIIRLLLASPSSLIILCLSKNNVYKAQQVMQLFQISNKLLENEINFIEIYEKLNDEINKMKKIEPHSSQSEQSILSPMEMVRKVTAAGLHSIGITSNVERVISIAPKLQGFDRCISEHRTAASLLYGLNKELMVACDIALTLGTNRDVSLSLLDAVSQRLKPVDSRLPNISNLKPFMLYMSNISDTFKGLSKLDIDICQHSLSEHLKDWYCSLNLEILYETVSSFNNAEKLLNTFFESTTKIQIVTIKKLIKVLNKCHTFLDSRQIISKINVNNYLENLFRYLQTFSSLIIKCTKESSEIHSPFDVLSDNWDQILGKLIFDFDAPINHIERVCTRLQIDLLNAVVSTCCPNIPLNLQNLNIKLPIDTTWAKICLNSDESIKNMGQSNENPDVLSMRLLDQLINELLNISKSPILTIEDFKQLDLQSSTNINDILSETIKFKNCNLDLLISESEKISFLCNTTNLLFLHALVILGADWGLISSNIVEKQSAYNCIGYQIGYMGFVTLSALISQLVYDEDEQSSIFKLHVSKYWSMNEKRAHFVLTQGTIQSPIIQIMDSSIAEKQIRHAVTNYLNKNVRVEGSINEGCFALIIPRLVLTCLGLPTPSCLEHAIEAKDEPIAQQQQSVFPYVTHLATDCGNHLPDLLLFLQTYATDKLQLNLVEWADAWTLSKDEDTKELVITVEENNNKFGIILPSSLEIINSESSESFICSTIHYTWENKVLSNSVKNYLDSHCPVISYLATRLRQNTIDMEKTKDMICLDNYLLDYIDNLSSFNRGNITLTALQPWSLIQQQYLWSILDRLYNDIQENECMKLILSLPEAFVLDDIKLQTFKDILLYNMANRPQTQGIELPWCLALRLGNPELRARCVLDAIQFWPGIESIETLKVILGESNVTNKTRNIIISTLHKVTIYQQVHQILCYYQKDPSTAVNGWYDVYKLSESNPGRVLQSLIEAKQYRLCIPWAELHGIPHRAQHLVNASFLSLLLETENADYSPAEKLLRSVPVPQAISICRRLLGSLNSISSLKFVVKFALNNCKIWLEENKLVWCKLQLWNIGLSILALLSEQEQQRDHMLASQPHLLIEQLLMNTRLAILSSALNILRTSDTSAIPTDSPAHPIVLDSLLRQYASKALDFRVSKRVILPEPLTTSINLDDELLQSLSTGSTGSVPTPFIMPAITPNKDQWVPNDEALECMCCTLVTFSMFNRRHHCRRCGRVICGSCSSHKMKVDGYGDLPVRICDDCKSQMHRSTKLDLPKNSALISEPSASSSSQILTEWKFTGEEQHDFTVREEFAFEHAPSVSLCLSILALHSEHSAAQPRFLLDAADQMLQLLIPPKAGYINPELDYGLVIKMARSLVVAAKVRYAKAALNSGVAHCDRLLGQVDLLSLLVRSGCASLLPTEALPLSGHSLRHLRDRLVGAELWPLALEVSTKAGLERGGVWAAWGKACIRSGRWIEARDHLSHCLIQSSTNIQDPSPAPLLMEIISILEETKYIPDNNVMKQSQHLNAPALAVLHSLASLNSISQGKINILLPNDIKQTPWYEEIQYYLKTYGGPVTNLSFYLSHSDIKSALNYAKQNNIDPDIFAEYLYKPCLRQGIIGELHKEMSNIDSSLELWKDTLLHIGRYLEKHGFFNALYQLQIYSNDIIRAAMTCIRFYQLNARCYNDLITEHLNNSRKHLEEVLNTTKWSGADSKQRENESPVKETLTEPNETQLPLKLSARQLNHYINVIKRQLEVTKFLQYAEKQGYPVVRISEELLKDLQTSNVSLIPTLFGSNIERTHVSSLVLLCGKNVEEGFGIVYRIIQDFHLKPLRVFSLASKWFIEKNQITNVELLTKCIISAGSTDPINCADDLILYCVQLLGKDNIKQTEDIIELITDSQLKIQAYIISGQLTSAYLLAVKLGNVENVKIIVKEAEKQNEPHILRICLRWLDSKGHKQ